MKRELRVKRPVPLEECRNQIKVLARPIEPRAVLNIQAGKCVVRVRTEPEFYRWVEFMGRLQHYSEEEISKGYATGWVFRGMENRKWHIVSSFHRHHGLTNVNGIKAIEKLAYKRFLKANCLDYTSFDTTLDMASYVQHYGGYTRLIDFSMSFAVALYFAIHNPSENTGAVWAVDCKCLRAWQRSSKVMSAAWPGFKRAASIIRSDKPRLMLMKNRDLANSILEDSEDRDHLCTNGRILWLTPIDRNERIQAQAGLFLMPTLLSKSFEDQLADPFDNLYSKKEPIDLPETYREMRKLADDYRLIRFDFCKRVYGVARAFLRGVNVTDGTLRL